MWITSNTSPNQVKFTFDFTQLRFFWAASSLSFVATWNMSAWRVITNIPSVCYSWTHTPGIPWSWNFSDKLLWERRTNHAAIRHSPEVSKPSMEFDWRSEEIWPKKKHLFHSLPACWSFLPKFRSEKWESRWSREEPPAHEVRNSSKIAWERPLPSTSQPDLQFESCPVCCPTSAPPSPNRPKIHQWHGSCSLAQSDGRVKLKPLKRRTF